MTLVAQPVHHRPDGRQHRRRLWLLWWTRRSRGDRWRVRCTTTVTSGTATSPSSTSRCRAGGCGCSSSRWCSAAVYLVLYPGLGSFQGALELDGAWRARRAGARQRASASSVARALRARRSVTATRADTAALGIGRNLFLNNCAACHGSDGAGAPDFPNLTDDDWLWGGDPDTVVATIADGRTGVMPAWGRCSARRCRRRARLRVEPAGSQAHRGDAAPAAQVRAALRGLPRRGRPRQSGAGRAEPHGRHLAVRRLDRHGARDHREGAGRDHARARRASRRDARQTTGGLRASR